jgi:hypothetical protein
MVAVAHDAAGSTAGGTAPSHLDAAAGSTAGGTDPSHLDDAAGSAAGGTAPSHLDAIVAFVRSVGLEIRFADVDGSTVLPGIEVDAGVLVVDRDRLAHAGDVLHEAGHLAVLAPAERRLAGGRLASTAAQEMMAIAWSYAAVVHLGLPATVVFHEAGYRNGSAALVENFANGRTIGVPMLQWLGLTADAERAGRLGVDPYPAMLAWARTD